MPTVYVKKEENKLKKKKILGLVFILTGILMFLYFFFPIISYQLFLGDAYASSNIEAPIPKYMVVGGNSGIASLVTQGIDSLTHNYNDARSWYPKITSNITPSSKTKVSSYFISIPNS